MINKLKTLLNDFGIPFEEIDNNIIIEVDREMVGGYVESTTQFNFDTDGNFVEMEIW